MYYLVYKTTNLVTGEIYIGAHRTKNKNDGYLGSGVGIKESIKTHGVHNFTREILYEAESEEEMYEKEIELVTLDFVKSENTLNRMVGGTGKNNINAMPGLNNKGKTKEQISERGRLGYIAAMERYGVDHMTAAGMAIFKKRIEERGTAYIGENPFKGRKHSDETKRKIGSANSRAQKGRGNSQYGTCWVYNLELKQNKKIKRDELPEYLDLGWVAGRKMFTS